jgi:mannose-1-phosphate guanylyltransferase
MRHALILAGGSGTRLWPMSRASLPKQLIPFLGGRSLLQLAFDRLEPLIPADRRCVCAGDAHARVVREALPGLSAGGFLGEPVGRDTLNAVGFGAAVIARRDPEAVIAVFTADHLIEPVDRFQRIVESGLALVERHPGTLVTFGIAPTGPVTGYGYLELGRALEGEARLVSQFKEKPDAETARRYVEAGPDRYLWNSGMFVWRASTLLDCIRRYEPEVAAGLARIAEAWGTPRSAAVLAEVYPGLRKISVDHAVMEKASRDPAVQVAAVPMPLRWLDVGSWPSFAQACPRDADGNAVSAGKSLLLSTARTLVASDDPGHLVAVLGCEDLLVIHTRDATLVCRADQAEALKELHRRVGEQFGPGLL